MTVAEVYQLGHGSLESVLQYELFLINSQSSSTVVLIEKLLVYFLNVNCHGFRDVMLLLSFLVSIFNGQNTKFQFFFFLLMFLQI